MRKSERTSKRPELLTYEENHFNTKFKSSQNTLLSNNASENERNESIDVRENKQKISTKLNNNVLLKKSTKIINYQVGSFMDLVTTNQNSSNKLLNWIELYKTDKVGATVELVNFLLLAAGSEKNWIASDVDLEALEPEELDVLLKDMMEMMADKSGYMYPLTEKPKTKSSRSFRDNFDNFWIEWVEHIISIISSSIYELDNNKTTSTTTHAKQTKSKKSYGIEILRTVIDQLVSLSSMSMVNVRVSITDAALCIAKGILKRCVMLKNELSTVQRQINAEVNKSKSKEGVLNKPTNPKYQAILKQQTNINLELEQLNEFVNTLFNSIFVHRVKDFNPDVRSIAIQYLKEFILFDMKKPMKVEYLKYLGWACYDYEITVRINAITAIQNLLQDDLSQYLQDFVEHFMDRFIEIAVGDIDYTVSLLMIQSFRTMQRLGLLDAISEDKLDAVDLLIFDSQAHIRVRQETLAFVMDHTEGFDEVSMEESGIVEQPSTSLSAKNKKKPVKIDTSNALAHKKRIALQLETLTEFVEHHLAGNIDYSYMLAEACIALKKFDMIYDWTTFTSLLLKENDESLTNTPLRPSQAAILLRIFVYCAEDLNKKRLDSSLLNKNHYHHSTTTMNWIEHWQALNDCLMHSLPSLLIHFKGDESNLTVLVNLLECTEYNASSERLLKSLLKVVLDLIDSIRNPTILSKLVATLKVWMHLSGTISGLISNAVKKLFNTNWNQIKEYIQLLQEYINEQDNSRKSKSTNKRKSKSLSATTNKNEREEIILVLHSSLLKFKLFCEQIDCRAYATTGTSDSSNTTMETIIDEIIEITELIPRLLENTEEKLSANLSDSCTSIAKYAVTVIYSTLLWQYHDVIDLGKQIMSKVNHDENNSVIDIKIDSKMEKLVNSLIDGVISLREKLIDILSTWIHLSINNNNNTNNVDIDDQISDTLETKSSHQSNDMLNNNYYHTFAHTLRLEAFNYILDIRSLFPIRDNEYKYLDRVAFAPSQDLLAGLRKVFESEGERIKLELLNLNQKDPENIQAITTLSEVISESLLLPLSRPLIFDVTNLNRRQAAAILYYLIDSNTSVEDTVKYIMRRLKEMDIVKYLEIHLVALKGVFTDYISKIVQARNIAMDNDDDDEFDIKVNEQLEHDGYSKYELFAKKLAQSLGIAKLKDISLVALVNFFKASIDYAFSNHINNLGYLSCLYYYTRYLSPIAINDIIHYLKEVLESKSTLANELEEYRSHDNSDNTILPLNILKYIDFFDHIQGRGRSRMTSRRKSSLSTILIDDDEEDNDINHNNTTNHHELQQQQQHNHIYLNNSKDNKYKPLIIKSQVLLEEDLSLISSNQNLLLSTTNIPKNLKNKVQNTTTNKNKINKNMSLLSQKIIQKSKPTTRKTYTENSSSSNNSDDDDNNNDDNNNDDEVDEIIPLKSQSTKSSKDGISRLTANIVLGLDIEDDDDEEDSDDEEDQSNQQKEFEERNLHIMNIDDNRYKNNIKKRVSSDISVLDSIPSRRRFR